MKPHFLSRSRLWIAGLAVIWPIWQVNLAQAQPVQQFTLANGMTLIVKPDARAPTVVHMLWVRVGSMDEVDGTSGVAHVLEHMLFKGSAQLKPGEFSRRVAALGGRENAFTNKEYTAFVTRVPQRHAEVGLDLLGDILTAPALRDADIEVERQVILEEIAMDDDSPDDVVHRMFAEQLFVDHPLGRETAGTRDSVLGIS
ncbi:MAG: insulinase family protein, partial [Rhodobacteraceae bacterium]|nr:insulinase family protein [Paracoccaceae bacterium]